jgi:hypothetical protein
MARIVATTALDNVVFLGLVPVYSEQVFIY